jgi:hypothetical protein
MLKYLRKNLSIYLFIYLLLVEWVQLPGVNEQALRFHKYKVLPKKKEK